MVLHKQFLGGGGWGLFLVRSRNTGVGTEDMQWQGGTEGGACASEITEVTTGTEMESDEYGRLGRARQKWRQGKEGRMNLCMCESVGEMYVQGNSASFHGSVEVSGRVQISGLRNEG